MIIRNVGLINRNGTLSEINHNDGEMISFCRKEIEVSETTLDSGNETLYLKKIELAPYGFGDGNYGRAILAFYSKL